MLITIYHSYFRSPQEGGGIRSYHLAKKLLKEGHDVKVVSRHNKLKGEQLVDGIPVLYLPIPYKNDFGVLRRSLVFILFLIRTTWLASKNKCDLNYIISTPLTNGLIGLVAKNIRKTPFIFEVGDLWPDVPIELGIIKNRSLHRILLALEKKIYQHSVSVVALSPPMKKIIEEKTNGSKKVTSIPNFSDCEFFKPSDPPAAFTKSTPFNISYVGTFGLANDLEQWLDWAKVLQKHQLPVQIKMMGDGARKQALKTKIEQEEIRNVELLPYSGYEGVKKLLESTHAVIVSFSKGQILHTGSPNKFFDGLAAGKLIIHNLDGWIKDLTEKNDCSLIYDPENPNEAVSALKYLIADPSLFISKQKNARNLALREFEKGFLLDKWLKFILSSFDQFPQKQPSQHLQ